MADVSKIVGALERSLAELDCAESSVAAARGGAVTIEAHAAEAGLLGIAAGIRVLTEQLDRLQEMRRGVFIDVSGALATVRQVPEDLKPDDVIATLTPVVQRIGTASAGSGSILTELAAAAAQAEESLRGGKPQKMLGLLGEVEQAVTRTAAHLTEAKARTEEVIAEAIEMGNFPVGVAA